MSRIVLATTNRGKIKEIQAVFEKYNINSVPQADLDVSEIPETGLSFVENALIKCRHASKSTGLPALGDDAGIMVDALNGAPGLRSARYAGDNATTQDNLLKLLHAMEGIKNRQARFHCSLVYLRYSDDEIPIICEGTWEGSVLLKPQGTEGFSYDPIFYVPTHACSAAEIPLDEKNRISHRGQALLKIITQIKHDH